MTLFQLCAEMAAIEDALIENGGEITEEIAQALEETEQSLPKKVDNYAAIIHKFDYTEAVLDAEIKRLQERKKVVKNAKERMKDHVCDTMGRFALNKIESNFNTFSRRRSTKVEVNEETILAPYLLGFEEYKRTLPPHVQVPDLKVSKSAIKDMLKSDGVLPAGAEIVESYSLIMK